MAMNEVFERWCEEEGVRQHISKKRLFAALRDMGVTDGGKTGLDRYWSGLRFRNEQERFAAERGLSGQGTPGGLGNIFGGCNNIWIPFPVFPEKSYEKSIV